MVGETIELKCDDDIVITAYKVAPSGAPRGGIVVLQDILGVNHHIRAVCDHLAEDNYLTIAPALFERAQKGVELGYMPTDIQLGNSIISGIPIEKTLLDIAAAGEAVKQVGKIGILGFGWGGTLAFAAACKLDALSACVSYYGEGIYKHLDLLPKIPLMLHFGALDVHVPQCEIDEIKKAFAQNDEIYIYEDADTGFDCDERASYNKNAATLAAERTATFFQKYLA